MSRIFTAVCSIALMMIASSVFAAELATPDQAKAIVEESAEFYKKNGHHKTVELINKKDSKFSRNDLYVFIIDMKGVMTAHGYQPKLTGRDMLNLKDPDGVFIIQEMIKKIESADGKGWVDYKWPNPATKKISNKTSYVVKLNNQYWLGAGAYKK